MKIGIKDRMFSAKEGYYGDVDFKRVKSAFKLLKEFDGWKVKNDSSFNGMVDMVTKNDDEFDKPSKKEIKHIKEKVEEYDYRASYFRDKNEIEIWSNHLGAFKLRNPKIEVID